MSEAQKSDVTEGGGGGFKFGKVAELVTLFVLISLGIYVYIIARTKFFENAMLVIIVGVVFFIAIFLMQSGGRRGLIAICVMLTFGSGYILLVNRFFERVYYDNLNGLITWPLATFMFMTFVVMFVAFVVKHDRPKWSEWVFPLMFFLGTATYSLIWGSLYQWFWSAVVSFTVSLIMLMSSKKVRKFETKAIGESILSGFLASAAISTTLLILMTVPTVMAVVLSGNKWSGLIASFGSTIATTWLGFNLYSIAIKKLIKRNKQQP